MPTEPSMLERAVQDQWFAAQALPAPSLEIHPDDEMARLDLLKTTPERRRMFYMRTGHEAFAVLQNALRCAGHDGNSAGQSAPSLLDFACGYGRVLRYIVQARGPSEVHACDIVEPAVEFVARAFGVHAIRSRTRAADVVLPRRYAVICVFSLFSHLPRASFAEYLRRLHEQLEPDGLLLFSTLSPHAIPESERDPSGFTYQRFSGIPHLDVEEYGSTFVTPARVAEICAELGLARPWTLERELWRIQDVHVVTRRDVPGLRRWTHTALPRGAILECRQDSAGIARATGYVRVPVAEHPLREVALVIDGERRIPCAFRAHPSLLPESEGGRFFAQTDWLVEGPAAELLGGTHVVAAVATTKSGVSGCFDVTRLAQP